jgi:hypothetical protein
MRLKLLREIQGAGLADAGTSAGVLAVTTSDRP